VLDTTVTNITAVKKHLGKSGNFRYQDLSSSIVYTFLFLYFFLRKVFELFSPWKLIRLNDNGILFLFKTLILIQNHSMETRYEQIITNLVTHNCVIKLIKGEIESVFETLFEKQ